MLYIAAKENKKNKYEKKESSFWTVKKKFNSADLSNKFCFRSAKREDFPTFFFFSSFLSFLLYIM